MSRGRPPPASPATTKDLIAYTLKLFTILRMVKPDLSVVLKIGSLTTQ